MASLNKLRELREHPTVKTRAILIQASQEEGATTIPQGSRTKWSEARSVRNGDDIVWTAMKVAAARKSDIQLTTECEHNDYLGGFGIVHTLAANCRIVKWDSAA